MQINLLVREGGLVFNFSAVENIKKIIEE